MKKSYQFIASLAALGVLAAIPLFTIAAPPQPPHMFYGNITINGALAPVGTIVSAKTQEGTERGSLTTVELGQYGEAGAFGKKLLVRNEIANGSILTFYVNGTASPQTFAFSSGEITLLDIAVSIAPPPSPTPIPAPTPTSIPVPSSTPPVPAAPTPPPISNPPSSPQQPSVGGGGGGSSGGDGEGNTSAIIPGPSPLPRHLADINKDGKIDIFDFNLVMVHWGETTPSNIADINKDGKVDILDFNLLMIHWT